MMVVWHWFNQVYLDMCCVKVLSVNVVNSKLILTHKKSLVNSKMPSVTSYSDLRTGTVVEGCVVSIKSTGLVVTFYNNVKVGGFVPLWTCSNSLARSHLQSRVCIFVPSVYKWYVKIFSIYVSCWRN